MNKITLTLSVEQVNAILFSLAKMPYENVAELITDVRKQAQDQLENSPKD